MQYIVTVLLFLLNVLFASFVIGAKARLKRDEVDRIYYNRDLFNAL